MRLSLYVAMLRFIFHVRVSCMFVLRVLRVCVCMLVLRVVVYVFVLVCRKVAFHVAVV